MTCTTLLINFCRSFRPTDQIATRGADGASNEWKLVTENDRGNGDFAGGFIAGPARVNVTAQLKPGQNTIEILPQAPKGARLVVYPVK